MAENSKLPIAILSIVTVVCLGGSAVLWVKWRTLERDLKSEVRVSKVEVDRLKTKLKLAQATALEAIRPLEVETAVVSESEFESLRVRLRQTEGELKKLKEKSARLELRTKRQQEGMKAAAGLQGKMREEIAATKKDNQLLKTARDVAKREVDALKRTVKNLQAQLAQLKKLRVPKTKQSKLGGKPASNPIFHEDGGSDKKNQSQLGRRPPRKTAALESARLAKKSVAVDTEDMTLKRWLAGKMAIHPTLTPRDLANIVSHDANVAAAVSELMGDPQLAPSALNFARAMKWWTLERVISRAESGLPSNPDVVRALGALLAGKAAEEKIPIIDLRFTEGLLGVAYLRQLASLPSSEVPLSFFVDLIHADDKDVALQAHRALLDPKREREIVALILARRAEKNPLPVDLEEVVWQRLGSTAATAVALALFDPELNTIFQKRILGWAEGKDENLQRRVAMETLALTVRGPQDAKVAWGKIWQNLWPEAGMGGAALLSFLEAREGGLQEMMSVLVSPAFGCSPAENLITATRKQQMSCAKQVYDETMSQDAKDQLYLNMLPSQQPLFIPLMENALSSLSPVPALDVASRLFAHKRAAGRAWFQDSIDHDFDRRMRTVERLFDLAIPEAYEVARSIVEHGDERTTYRLVELGWERNVPMPQADIEKLLRSEFLDPVRMDVFMAYFRRCVGTKLNSLATEALFDPRVRRPETLLDYLSTEPNQKLLPLFLRYLESERYRVRESALRALRRLDLKSEVGRLMTLINDPNKMVRLQLAHCLGALGGDAVARGGLLVLCRDESAFVREAAVTALANHTKGKLLPALRFALGDHVKDVAVAAAESLIRIGSHDQGAYDLLFRSVEDRWLGPGARKFLKNELKVDFATRDEWRSWWALNGHN